MKNDFLMTNIQNIKNHPYHSIMLYALLMLGSMTLIDDLSILLLDLETFDSRMSVYFTLIFSGIFMVLLLKFQYRKKSISEKI